MGFQWPMLEDLLNSMQNHEDWRGQAMHGHQEAGAAAAATAPVFFFGVGDERHISVGYGTQISAHTIRGDGHRRR